MRDGQGQFVFQFSYAGDDTPMITTIGFDASGTDPGDLPVWAETAAGAYADNILPLQSSVVTLDLVRAEKHVGAGVVEGIYDANSAGGASAASCPSNTAFLVRKHSNGVGRGKTGHMYIPGVPEGDVDANGAVSAGVMGDWNDALDAFRDVFPGFFLVVNHGAGAPTLRSFILNLSLDPIAGSQRRRMRR